MFPDVFRELDQVVSECFDFLVSEKGCTGPWVEYWRDYFLVYQCPPDVKIRIGMLRDSLSPFILFEYRNEGQVLFPLRPILKQLNIPVDATQFPLCESGANVVKQLFLRRSIQKRLEVEWPNYLRGYSLVLRKHYREIVAYVRTNGIELAHGRSTSKAIADVLQAADETSSYDYVIGPGGYFLKAQFLPCDRESFWRITNAGYAVSYGAPGTCPSCGFTGNGGLRVKQTATSKGMKSANVRPLLPILLLIIWIVGLVAVAVWQRVIVLPLLLGAMGVSLFFKVSPKAVSVSFDSFPPKTRPEGNDSELEYYCPNCGSTGTVRKPMDQAA